MTKTKLKQYDFTKVKVYKGMPPETKKLKQHAPLSKDDVWGIDSTILVARSGDKCPIYGDVLGYKDVTAVCSEEQMNEVHDWITYVQGGSSHDWTALEDGRYALRSEYLCW